MNTSNRSQSHSKVVQRVWGAVLIFAGVAVFFRIPQVIPQLVQMGQSSGTVWFVRIFFYLIGILLIGGGLKKVVLHVRPEDSAAKDRLCDKGENG